MHAAGFSRPKATRLRRPQGPVAYTRGTPSQSDRDCTPILEIGAILLTILVFDALHKNLGELLGCCRNQASLTMWIPVKHFVSVRTRALRGARHFALVEGSAIPTKARS